MKCITTFLCFSLAIFVLTIPVSLGCAHKDDNKKDSLPLSNSVNGFTAAFYKKAADKTPKENLLFSPIGLYLAFGAVFNGARGNTAHELSNVFLFSKEQGSVNASVFNYLNTVRSYPAQGLSLLISNGLWVQKEFLLGNAFKNDLTRYFDAQIENVDFKDPENTLERINKWVSENTEQNIKQILNRDAISPLTRLVITNAVYFKGLWMSPFDKNQTKDMPFYIDDKTMVTVPFMSRTAQTGFMQTQDYYAAALAYKNEKAELIIVMPKENGDLALVENKFMDGTLLTDLAEMKQKKLGIAVPKLKIEAGYDLKTYLMEMGVKDAFGDKADFSGMFDEGESKKELGISNAFHKAFINMDEVGTEAGAATAVVMNLRALKKPIVFNRPFLFFIRDTETSTILFTGRILNPAGGQ